MDSYVNLSLMKEMTQFFHDLEKAKDERERYQLREKVMTLFHEHFWNDQGHGHWLDLVYIGLKSFNRCEDEFLNSMMNSSMKLFQKSLLGASLICLLALNHGYLNFKFLQDLFHAVLLMDYKLFQEGLSTHMVAALEAERKVGGEGEKILSKLQNSDRLKNVFEFHQEKVSIGDVKKYFHNLEVFKMSHNHHEKFDGSGFPHYYNTHELSDVEDLFIFVHNLLPFEGGFRLAGKTSLKSSLGIKEDVRQSSVRVERRVILKKEEVA